MIFYAKGNLLAAHAEALVNTVNTVGVMGKGIALMFKKAFPDNFKAYEAACNTQTVRVGHMFVVECKGLMGDPRWIINFPTKEHWRYPSKIEWIETGLVDLRRLVIEKGIKSVAISALGCGNGGLNWPDVRLLIESALGGILDVRFLVYEPTG